MRTLSYGNLRYLYYNHVEDRYEVYDYDHRHVGLKDEKGRWITVPIYEVIGRVGVGDLYATIDLLGAIR